MSTGYVHVRKKIIKGEANPIISDNAENMASLATSSNVGKIVKYTGEEGKFIPNALYLVVRALPEHTLILLKDSEDYFKVEEAMQAFLKAVGYKQIKHKTYVVIGEQREIVREYETVNDALQFNFVGSAFRVIALYFDTPMDIDNNDLYQWFMRYTDLSSTTPRTIIKGAKIAFNETIDAEAFYKITPEYDGISGSEHGIDVSTISDGVIFDNMVSEPTSGGTAYYFATTHSIDANPGIGYITNEGWYYPDSNPQSVILNEDFVITDENIYQWFLDNSKIEILLKDV